MPQGDKRHYTDKQRRKADHIEESFRSRGYTKKEAQARAWATVNAIHKGGELKGGSGYGKPEDKSVYRRGGRRGGRASATRTATKRPKRASGGTRKSSTGRSATKRVESKGRRQMRNNVRSVGRKTATRKRSTSRAR
ncbi:MAG TPA: plasmid stabilization protein [Candidatus Thermoplasmatota archaeon]|nr:plasmid stabilization protein [Candidatus Thermoplasmatota archaeon]